MLTSSFNRLQFLCLTIPDLLKKIPEKDFSFKPVPTKWSKKEILGHLIASAANNHQRFVRCQFENIPTITYNQDNWNYFSYSNKMESNQLILFWESYNRYLLELIKNIPLDNLQKECNVGKEKNVTIEWLFEDYIVHMEHHLKQIVEY